MLKESLHIENFGPLKNIHLDNIVPMTVFVGESGSGKSSIMKVLVLFRWIYKKLCIRSYLRNSGMQKSPFRFDFAKLISNSGFDGFVNEQTKIIYSRGDNNISYENGKLNTSAIISNADLSLDKMSFISDKRNVIPELLTNGISISNSFYLNETWEDFKKASEDFDAITIPYLQINLVKRKVQNGFRFFIEECSDSYKVGFEDASSGIQNVVPMITIIDYFVNRYDLVNSFNRAIISVLSDVDLLSKFKPEIDIGKVNYKNLFFHIEEPELSLYPDSQLRLMEQIVNSCYRNKNSDFTTSCMITTHSPYIVNYLNLLIKKKILEFNDVKVYEVIAGSIRCLNIEESSVINTALLSEPIANIYAEYNELPH